MILSTLTQSGISGYHLYERTHSLHLRIQLLVHCCNLVHDALLTYLTELYRHETIDTHEHYGCHCENDQCQPSNCPKKKTFRRMP